MIGTTAWIGLLASTMVNAVLFGFGIVLVLSIPALAAHAATLIPVVVVLSFVLAPFPAAIIARRMRLRTWGIERWREGDIISG